MLLEARCKPVALTRGRRLRLPRLRGDPASPWLHPLRSFASLQGEAESVGLGRLPHLTIGFHDFSVSSVAIGRIDPLIDP